MAFDDADWEFSRRQRFILNPVLNKLNHFHAHTTTSHPHIGMSNEGAKEYTLGSKMKYSFKSALIALKDFCDKKSEKMISICKVCNKFGFQRRRFYDVINVLEIVGVAHKINSDNFYWNGLNTNLVRNNIFDICNNSSFDVFNHDKSIYDIFFSNDSQDSSSSQYSDDNDEDSAIVGICNITKYFLATFVALNKKTIDVKELSYILTRRNKARQKTMLCKLYLVGNILESVGIVYKKGKVTSEFSFVNDYFIDIKNIVTQSNHKKAEKGDQYILDSYKPENDAIDPLSIVSLLNHKPHFNKPDYIIRRRAEYSSLHKNWIASSPESF